MIVADAANEVDMDQADNMRKQNGALALLALLCLVLSVFAWWQEPVRDANREPARWDERDYWLQPVERNVHLRLQSVQTDLDSVAALENGDLIAVGGEVVLRSTTQGAHWQTHATIPGVGMKLAITLPGGSMLALGRLFSLDQDIILHSADQGRTWQVQYKGPNSLHEVNSIESADGTLLVAVGADGTLLRSADQGARWQKMASGTTEDLFAVKAIGKGRIAAAGANGTLLISQDAGQTWQSQNTGSKADFYSMTTVPSGHILLGGRSGEILRSSDMGITWQSSSDKGKGSILDLLGLSNGYVIAVGNNGVLLLSKDQGETWQSKFSFTKGRLNGLARFPNGGIVAIGENGMMLQSSDLGETWQAKTGKSEFKKLYPLLSLPNGRIITRGPFGYVHISTDRGQTWGAREIAGSRTTIRFIFWLSGERIWAVDDDGLSLLSTDQGETWRVIADVGMSLPDDATVLPNGQIIVSEFMVGKRVSEDQGITWKKKKYFLEDGCRINIGEGITICRIDGLEVEISEIGKIWQTKPSITQADYISFDVDISSNGRVITVGEAGKMLLSTDQGEIWRTILSGTKERLVGVRSLPNGRFIAVGNAGTLLLSTDQGETWQSKSTATKANLQAITRMDDGRILVVAENGEALFSDDHGDTWQAINYRRYPARWYWCVLMLLLLPALWLLRHKRLSLATDGLNELQASDAPELDPKQDRLGHHQIVQGVTAFMCNEDTRMPLTMAVTGAWGLGKSSLMGFLKADLEVKGFRCVWFNPWHYQKEEHILAALLEQVQQCVVPPLLTVAGMRFRMALLIKRVGQRSVKCVLLLTLALAGILAFQTQGDSLRGALGYIVSGPQAKNQPAPDNVDTRMSVTTRAMARASDSASTVASVPAPSGAPSASANASTPMSASAAADSNESTPSSTTPPTSPETVPAKAIAAQHLGLMERATKVIISTFFTQGEGGESAANAFLAKLLAVLLTLLSTAPLLLAGLHAMQAFSVKANILFANLDGWLGLKRAKAQTSFRASFAAEFCEVTEALAPARLTIFIDDLDRCKPDVVMEIMEAINFLSVSGDCFIVLGIAPDKVAHAIGLSQKDIAGQLEPSLSGDQARLKYGNMYLRKLVNIEIPVGSLNSDKVRNLLVPPAPPPDLQPPLTPEQARRDKSMVLALNSLQALAALLSRAVQVMLLLFLPLMFLWGVANLPQWKTPSVPVPTPPLRTSKPIPYVRESSPTTASTPAPTIKGLPEPSTEVYIRASGDPAPPFAVNLAPALFLLLLLAVAFRAWLHGLQQRLQDTSEFKQACRNWAPVIGLLLDSTREVKRWQNRVRYINARLRLIIPPPSFWQRAKDATRARRAQPGPLALCSALITSLRLSDPVVTQALPEAQLVALCALMSVASRFDCIHALKQLPGPRSVADIICALPAQLPPNDGRAASYQQIKMVVTQAIMQPTNPSQPTPAAHDPPITEEVLQHFFEIAEQFEISEKPI